MYCQSCGAKNEDDARMCVYCGKPMATWRPDNAAKPDETSASQPYQPYAQPQQPYQQPQQNYGSYGQRPVYVPVENVPDYLVFSILVTILCCLVGGIVAIIYSSQVKTKVAQGDIAGAWNSSRTALGWCWASLIIGFLGNTTYIILAIIGATSGI